MAERILVLCFYPRAARDCPRHIPDLLCVSTYFPEGAEIAKALVAAGTAPRCLMGLANVDPGFLSGAGLMPSQRCLFSGVPAAPQLPSARRFVRHYRKAFKREPGVWGVFTYDSARILFGAIEKAGGIPYRPLLTIDELYPDRPDQ